MLTFTKINRSNKNTEYKSTILIPSWNNLPYLQLCIRSIKENSTYNHQIVVTVNDGKDGTLEWIKEQTDIDYVHFADNAGICYGLNACRSLVKSEYVVYANDDMYFLPQWDTNLWHEIDKYPKNDFMLSATLIEPNTNNACGVCADYGTSVETFREKDLKSECATLVRDNWSSSTWPPCVVHIDNYDLVGWMSIEFSPGMTSDNDLARKLWEIGVRDFVGVGNSLVYHFGCKSTGRIKKNKGHYDFTAKWGISASDFMKKYLHRGENIGDLRNEPKISCLTHLKYIIKQVIACIRR